MKTPKFVRRAPPPHGGGRTGVKSTGLVKVGGVDLPAQHAAWLNHYLVRLNGTEAARAVGQTETSASAYASLLLSNSKVREALRCALVDKQRRTLHDSDEVARYWWALATADARELSGVHYVACHHCWGVDHDYQFTDVEQRERERDYHAQVATHQKAVERLRRDHPDAELPEAPLFFEGGGGGYTTNRYPRRGPDWARKIERYFASIERLVPEGLDANSDHSCPACFGDGLRTLWMADTRHLNSSAAVQFNGARQTKDGIEIKVRDRDAAMERFSVLTGMIGPLKVQISGDATQLTDEQLAQELSRRGVVIDGVYQVVEGTPQMTIENAPRLPVALPRPDLLRPRTS